MVEIDDVVVVEMWWARQGARRGGGIERELGQPTPEIGDRRRGADETVEIPEPNRRVAVAGGDQRRQDTEDGFGSRARGGPGAASANPSSVEARAVRAPAGA